MTAVAPRVLSAIVGGAFRPWRFAHDAGDRRAIVRELLSAENGRVLFYSWHRPVDPESGSFPRQQLTVVFSDGVGAAHYVNGDIAHEPVGAWLAVAERPLADPPVVPFDPWDPERVTLPTEALMDVEGLGTIVDEYAATGLRPTNARWAAVDWV